MKFYYPCQRFHPLMSWIVCTKLRIRESAQLKTLLELHDINPTHLLGHQRHEVDVCRGKEVSNHGAILRQPCRKYLKSTCTRSPCEYWHSPECQFYKNETGCKARDKCLFPHHKVDGNPVVTVKIVPKLGCVSQDSDALVSQRGKQSW